MLKERLTKVLSGKDSKKGFTLVELIIVLVILAVLAAILVPALLGFVDKAKEKQYALDAHTVYEASQVYVDEQYAKGTPNFDMPTLTAASESNKISLSAGLAEIKSMSAISSISSVQITEYKNGTGITGMEFTYKPDGSNDVTMTLKEGAWK